MNPAIPTETGLQIVPLCAFRDNYIWLMRRGAYALVVDPGDATPVLDYLQAEQLQLCAILVTHHHDDHAGGIADILARLPGDAPPVYGPAVEEIAAVDHPLGDGDRVDLPALRAQFEVIAVPGHTRGHIAYYGGKLADCGVLFCGDTLFVAGCGRVFEGTPEQMWHSLQRLAALPPTTQLYCAHEYSQANIRFALAVEADNAALAQRAVLIDRLRAAGQPTVPSALADELATNPFLRSGAPTVRRAAELYSGKTQAREADVFAAIRDWKNKF